MAEGDGVPAAALSPARSSGLIQYGRRLLRRDVDGAILTFTGRRPVPGRRARWPKIQGTAASATAGRPAMAPDASNGVRREAGLKAPRLARPDALKAVFPVQGGFESSQRVRKIAERGRRKATRWGGQPPPLWLRSRRPRPVAPSPALPAGPLALAIVERARDREGMACLRSARRGCAAARVLFRSTSARKRASAACRRPLQDGSRPPRADGCGARRRPARGSDRRRMQCVRRSA